MCPVQRHVDGGLTSSGLYELCVVWWEQVDVGLGPRSGIWSGCWEEVRSEGRGLFESIVNEKVSGRSRKELKG